MKCIIGTCKSNFKTSDELSDITFFRFTAERRVSWTRAIGRDPTIEFISPNMRICSLHFLPDDLERKAGKLFLKPGAIPSEKVPIRRVLAPIQNLVMEEGLSSSAADASDFGGTSSSAVEIKSNVDSSAEVHDEQLHYEELDVDKIIYPEMLLENEMTIPSSEKSSSSEVRSHSSDSTETASWMENCNDNFILNLFLIILGVLLYGSTNEEPGPRHTTKRKAESCSGVSVGTSSTDSEGFKGAVKKARIDVATFHTYSTSAKEGFKQLKQFKKKTLKLRERVKTSSRRVTRLAKKVTSLKQVLFH